MTYFKCYYFEMSQILVKFVTKLTFDMSGHQAIKNMISRLSQGAIFFPEDFSMIDSKDLIRTTLMRLTEEGYIGRLGFGIYYKSKIDEKWGTGTLYPSLDEIAKAIAKKDKARIIPTGSAALNMLGLSTQLQTNVVYYTDGSIRKIKIGDNKGIVFRRTTNMKNFAFKNELMQLIVAALKEIGNNKVTDEEKKIIAERLKQVPEEDFRVDLTLAPAWIQKLLKEIR